MANALAAAIAANRFGLGARRGEINSISGDPRGWLARNLGSDAAFSISASGLSSRTQAAEALGKFLEEVRSNEVGARPAMPSGNMPTMTPMPGQPNDTGQQVVPPLLREVYQIGRREIAARVNHAIGLEASFPERLVYFWSNHFTVAATKAVTAAFVGLFEREVIRRGLTGKFSDLLVSACRHPGMLMYLDQAQSIGPNSAFGQRRRGGINENLAREALELMTLGPQGGYTQADVTEFAKALTGWTVVGKQIKASAPNLSLGDFVFVNQLHEPGPRTVLGKTYPDDGEAQARAILTDLAAHPATARQVARQMARHFLADEPPASLVAQLERAFLASGGDLPTVHRALINAPEMWEKESRKFKTPNDFILSSLRALGVPRVEEGPALASFNELGQIPFRAPSPKGWPDDAASWAGADAIMKRLEWAQALAARVQSRTPPVELASDVLGPYLKDKTRQGIMRAESATQGLTLALLSPEFQRR
jgi:uncharacterized protein (DUF1800 family)